MYTDAKVVSTLRKFYIRNLKGFRESNSQQDHPRIH